jgi:succinoglycan biosynthesis transport protein ExoP
MENTPNIEQYLAIAKRRVWYAIIPFVAVLGAVLVVIELMPPVYRSEGKIAVESQQVPEGFVTSTVIGYANERIGIVKQRVMTKARLLDIIDRYKLFPELRGRVPDSVLVNKLRKMIFLDLVRDTPGTGGTLAFTLAFEYGDPHIAASVAEDLVNMYLAESVKARANRATETTEFLKQQTARLAEQVAARDAQIAEYKQEHGDALPEHLGMRMNMLQTSESSVRDLERQILGLEEHRRLLEIQRATVGTILSTGAVNETPILSPAQKLSALKAELAEKSAVYQAAHPDLKNLRRRISQLRRQVAAEGAKPGPQTSSSATDPARARIESEIVSIDKRIASLRREKKELQDKIKTLQANIMETPQVERGLKELTRGYDTLVAEYEQLSAKQRAAEVSENLEVEQKAERLVLLEPPQVPSVPVWPNKLKFFGIGVVLAAGSGAGAVFLAEVLDTAIRGPAMLTEILQAPPIAVIPILKNPKNWWHTRMHWMWLALAVLLVLILALAITHFFFEPLDVFIKTILPPAFLS